MPIEIIISGVMSLVTGLVGFLFGLRKSKADAKHVELENVEKAVTIWRGLAEQLQTKVIGLELKVNELQCENRRLHDEISKMHQMVSKMAKENEEMLKRLDNQLNQ